MCPNINDAFPSNYLKASDLQGREVIVTIDRVDFEPVAKCEYEPRMEGRQMIMILAPR